MSVNVLERILVRLLLAAGLVCEGQLADRWQISKAIDELERARD